MPSTPIYNYSNKKLEPAIFPDLARAQSVRLPNSATYARGTLLGEVVGTPGIYKAYASTVVAASGTGPTLSDSATAGTFAAQDYWAAFTYTNAVGETTISPPVKVTIGTGSHSIGVAALTPLPTGATGVKYYVATAADGPFFLAVANHNDGTAAVLSAVPADTAAQAPEVNTAFAASDGSATPIGILVFDCAVDSSGNIHLTDTAGAYPPNDPGQSSIAMWIVGYFACEELTGLDANAVSKMGRLIEGTTSNGILRLS